MEQFEQFKQNLKWFSGYITEPKADYTEKGLCKTKFAISLKKKKEDEAMFLNCILWDKKAEQFAENFKKGDMVTVGGVFTQNEYKGKTYINFDVKIYN